MSSLVGAVATAGLEAIAIFSKAYRAIGPIEAMATIEEQHQSDLMITEHPVEQGANITDHAYLLPKILRIRACWSDSPNLNFASIVGGSIGGGPGFSKEVFEKLLALQELREPFTIYTGKRSYPNMLLKSIISVSDSGSEFSLVAQLVCQQVIIVGTKTAAIEVSQDNSVQADPAATAAAAEAGSQSAVPAPSSALSDLTGLSGVPLP